MLLLRAFSTGLFVDTGMMLRLGTIPMNVQEKSDNIAKATNYPPQKPSNANHLPPDLAAVVQFHLDSPCSALLDQPPALEIVALVAGRGEAHSLDMMRTRVGGDGVRAALPDASREVEARLRVGRAVPVQDKAAITYGFLVCEAVGVIQCWKAG